MIDGLEMGSFISRSLPGSLSALIVDMSALGFVSATESYILNKLFTHPSLIGSQSFCADIYLFKPRSNIGISVVNQYHAKISSLPRGDLNILMPGTAQN